MMALRMNRAYNVGQQAEAHKRTLGERFIKYMEENGAVILGGLAALNREGNAYKIYYMQQENKR